MELLNFLCILHTHVFSMPGCVGTNTDIETKRTRPPEGIAIPASGSLAKCSPGCYTKHTKTLSLVCKDGSFIFRAYARRLLQQPPVLWEYFLLRALRVTKQRHVFEPALIDLPCLGLSSMCLAIFILFLPLNRIYHDLTKNASP